MTEPRVYVAGFSLFLAGCSGITSASPSAPSALISTQPSVTPSPAPQPPAPTHAVGPDVPAGLSPTQRVITGSVGPLASYAGPCYVERYACERYRFTMDQNGAVEVTLSWQGGERAMLIQLYRAGAGLVHEDLARGGSPILSFRRVDITAMEYELRVVNMEPNATHPFTLTLTTWQ